MSHKKAKVPKSLIEAKIQQGVKEQLEKRGNADFKTGYEKTENTEILVVLNEKRISWSCSNKVL